MGMQVSIDKVWPPKKQGGKYGTVKLTDGSRYLIPIAKINTVRSGMMAMVETHSEDWSNGAVTIIDNVVENPTHGGSAPASSYDPGAKDRQIWLQGIIQAAVHSRSWAAEEELRATIFEAAEVAQDAYDTFIARSAPKAPEPPKQAPQTDYRTSGRPYSTSPQDDPRFAAPVAGPDDYGAQR